MPEVDALEVRLWGRRVGVIAWDERSSLGRFEYDPDFIHTGLQLSPLVMPLKAGVYSFPEHARSGTFLGLPGLIADSLTEGFGNQLLKGWLARRGLAFRDLTPVERLCYIGSRGMGALEYHPDWDIEANSDFPVQVSELVDIAQQVLGQKENERDNLDPSADEKLSIRVGTSAGGAKAKAVIAWNESSGELRSGQVNCPVGFEHWLLKLAEVDNSEHHADRDVGRLEYAYYLMALAARIDMMESRLLPDGARAHFMTRRFDRILGQKIHMATFSGIAHEDRNPAGNTHYETLFSTARSLDLGQSALDQLYRRMVFNVLARNQDDHAKNHAFLMDPDGSWWLSPAYDLIFSFKKDSRWISAQQMRVNGKRDDFTRSDLLQAARAADVKHPGPIIEEVSAALSLWPEFAARSGLQEEQAFSIQAHFRRL
jgi:serine/threonine-protein kinase HipA